jgi:hypothetical protein
MPPDPAAFAVRAQSPLQYRIGGVISVLLGLLVLAVGIVFAWLLSGLALPEFMIPDAVTVTELPGSNLSDVERFGLFALTCWILSAGFCATALGLFQLVTGRSNGLLLRALLILGLIIFVVGGLASVLSGCNVGRICQ